MELIILISIKCFLILSINELTGYSTKNMNYITVREKKVLIVVEDTEDKSRVVLVAIGAL